MKNLMYPKTCATVESRTRFSDWFVARYDDGRVEAMRLRWKSGSKSSLRVVPGARIKVYRPPGLDHPMFRLRGD